MRYRIYNRGYHPRYSRINRGWEGVSFYDILGVTCGDGIGAATDSMIHKICSAGDAAQDKITVHCWPTSQDPSMYNVNIGCLNNEHICMVPTTCRHVRNTGGLENHFSAAQASEKALQTCSKAVSGPRRNAKSNLEIPLLLLQLESQGKIILNLNLYMLV